MIATFCDRTIGVARNRVAAEVVTILPGVDISVTAGFQNARGATAVTRIEVAVVANLPLKFAWLVHREEERALVALRPDDAERKRHLAFAIGDARHWGLRGCSTSVWPGPRVEPSPARVDDMARKVPARWSRLTATMPKLVIAVAALSLCVYGCGTPGPGSASSPSSSTSSGSGSPSGLSLGAAVPGSVPTPLASHPVPAAPDGAIGDILDVKAGYPIYGHAGCLLRGDKTVWCWGGPNILRYFGRGRTEPIPGPWQIDGVTDAVKLVSAALGHCAIRSNGKAVCWNGPATRAVDIGDVASLSGSQHHMCALLKNGSVTCSGKNYNGEIGRPPKRRGATGGIDRGDWAPVPDATDIVQLVGTCGLRRDGRLFCWGVHAFRPVHDGHDVSQNLDSLVPRVISDLPPAVRLSVGHERSCIVTSKSNVLCFARKEAHEPPIRTELDFEGAIDVTHGLGGAVILSREGRVYYWGPGPAFGTVDGNEWGKRKRKAFASKRPRRVPGIEGAVSISGSTSHVCATTREGRALCWGKNDHGQLGNGTLARAKKATYVVDFHPALMSGPGEKPFGCKPSLEVRRTCQQMAEKLDEMCELEPAPGYWNWGSRGGALCDEACMKKAMDEVNKRTVPACLCSCSEEYKQIRDVEVNRRMQSPPPMRPSRRNKR